MIGYRARALALLFLVLVCSLVATAGEQNTVDVLLSESKALIRSTPEKASATLQKLLALKSTFTPSQTDDYNKLYARFLGYQGRHEVRVAFVQSIIEGAKDPRVRAGLLFELIDGNRALGRYEPALQEMNESILLLPFLERGEDKKSVLQGAVTLLYSFRAYEDALVFAERLYSLEESKLGSATLCLSLADKVDLHFSLGHGQIARALVPEALGACDASKIPTFSLLIKTYAAIDQIDSGNYAKGLEAGLPLIQEFSAIGMASNWLAALEDAVARAYLNKGQLERAEQYGLKAYQRAQVGKDLRWQEKTSETMALIKRAQGQFESSVTYYDTNLALKKKVLNDQQQKNLAYQRVKFDTQDKANQMALLEQKNKTLGTEKALQQNKYQNLILLLTLGAVVLAILGAWLLNTLRLKNRFRASAQVDGLTQVSNRAHFTACAQEAFKDTTRSVSLVLFDMDLFKKINDTYGHATGDWVLKAVSATVNNQVRDSESLGRLGGEEFAFCLPNSTQDQAEILAERCRSAIAAIDTHASGFDFQISASFGIATRGAGQTTSFEETLVQADKALYLSKNEGRNRVTVYLHAGTV